ncbi:hypothetical protein HYU23_04105 [Candidatus Woesearchaeota archaeon]|nr:hypothetical protein [Candidatus Woesearchaeota archaeon]
MQKDYFSNFLYSIKSLKNNPVLYIPDLVFFVFAFGFTLLFFHLNNLTSIFGGQLEIFNNQIRSIVSTGPLFIRLIVSFIILIVINLIVGLSTIAMRFTIISYIIKNRKFKFFNVLKEHNKYILSVFLIKLFLFLMYFVPAFVFLGVGFLYKQLILIMVFFLLVLFVMFKFTFLFVYPVLFLKGIKNPVKVVRETLVYFRDNKLHCIIVGLFVGIMSFIISLVLNIIPVIWSSLNIFGQSLSILFIYLIIKGLIEITINLWANLFIFKNY